MKRLLTIVLCLLFCSSCTKLVATDYSAIYTLNGKQYCKIHRLEIEQWDGKTDLPAEMLGSPQEVLVEALYSFPNHTKYTTIGRSEYNQFGWTRSTWCPSCATLAREFESSLPPIEIEHDPLSTIR